MEEELTSEELTRAQYTRAQLLAQRYGHDWACNVAEPVDAWRGTDMEDLRWLVERRWLLRDAILQDRIPHKLIYQCARAWGEMEGWPSPILVGGNVVHTTGSRRLRWEIQPSGLVTLWVSRPSPRGDVMQVKVLADPRRTVIEYLPWGVKARHVESIEWALVPLQVDLSHPGLQAARRSCPDREEQIALLRGALQQTQELPEDDRAHRVEEAARNLERWLV